MKGKTKPEIIRIIHLIKKELGQTKATVAKEDPFQVLISTVLSQRTRDESTERASKRLFSKYRNPRQLSQAPLEKIYPLIRESGFYKTKALRIREISRILVEKYKGKVPRDFDKLISLPGVGRKTANCVLVYAYQIPAIPVDTHVHRISNRIGLVKTKTPEQTETELIRIVPRKNWMGFNDLFVKFGQRVCQPIKPMCWKCPITRECDYPNKNLKPK
ncbi:MAG: endonuclease III [Candidatus Aenigmarchaeota archaeon]|nr:endonuclease III [Candidatus Aenigmarchaeota archaeon]